MCSLVDDLARVLAPHGSMVFEFGDTYSGSGGAGGDYGPAGLREGQPEFDGSASRTRSNRPGQYGTDTGPPRKDVSTGWPRAKSLALIPELFRITLAYGRNPLTGTVWWEGGDRWMVRNVVRWVRPNPPVGALGDKFRPATSDLCVFTRDPKRWFDLDAVRTQPQGQKNYASNGPKAYEREALGVDGVGRMTERIDSNPAGAPPLDWWNITTSGYPGSHYAVYSPELCVIPVKSMCPEKVCVVCGEPSRRITTAVARSELKDLGPAIEQARKSAGLSRADFVPLFSDTYKNADSITAQMSNWERGKNVPSPEDWERLGTMLDLPDQFTALICGDRRWTESTIDYEHISDHPSGTTQDHTGRVYNRLPARKNRRAPDVWSDCGHGSIVCKTCNVLVPYDHAIQRFRSGTSVQSGVGSQEVLGESIQSEGGQKEAPRSVQGVRSGLHGEDAGGAHVQQVLLGEAGAHGGATQLSPAETTRDGTAGTHEQRRGDLHPGVGAGGLSGTPEERLDDGTSASDAGASGTTTGSPGMGPSSEWDQDRQPAGEPGDSESRQPSGNGDVSELWDGIPGSLKGYVCECGSVDFKYVSDQWRTGTVLDPFAGSGTTLAVATGHGRDAVGIDLDERNAGLALDRVGPMFLTVERT